MDKEIKPNNYAFIDGNNLHLTIKNLGWNLDYKRFRVYLKEHYDVVKAYYFIGYIAQYQKLYNALESYGYEMVYKPTVIANSITKGNIDADMVLIVMKEINNYERAIIVSSDGDFHSLVAHLMQQSKLECVLAPCRKGCSSLLKKAALENIRFMDNLRQKLELTNK